MICAESAYSKEKKVLLEPKWKGEFLAIQRAKIDPNVQGDTFMLYCISPYVTFFLGLSYTVEKGGDTESLRIVKKGRKTCRM